MRVLVTGGAGFIGSHVVDALVAEGHEAVVLDRRVDTNGAHRDVRDPDAWIAAMAGVDAVCHQAAMVGLGVSPGDVRAYVDHNDVGTAAGLWAMHRARFQGRLVLASSMVVYGEGSYACAEHGVVRPKPRTPEALRVGDFEPRCPSCRAELRPKAISEDAAVDPRNVYAATKLHQEHLCFAIGRELGIEVVALRYHNVYGPRMPPDTPYAGVAAIFLSALSRGEPPCVFEDGHQLRDFVHVGDVARANVLALTADGVTEGPFNICSGTPRSVAELAAALSTVTGGPEPVVTGEFRLGDVRHVFASPQRAAGILRFRAEIGFDEGLTELASAARPSSVVGGDRGMRR